MLGTLIDTHPCTSKLTLLCSPPYKMPTNIVELSNSLGMAFHGSAGIAWRLILVFSLIAVTNFKAPSEGRQLEELQGGDEGKGNKLEGDKSKDAKTVGEMKSLSTLPQVPYPPLLPELPIPIPRVLLPPPLAPLPRLPLPPLPRLPLPPMPRLPPLLPFDIPPNPFLTPPP